MIYCEKCGQYLRGVEVHLNSDDGPCWVKHHVSEDARMDAWVDVYGDLHCESISNLKEYIRSPYCYEYPFKCEQIWIRKFNTGATVTMRRIPGRE